MQITLGKALKQKWYRFVLGTKNKTRHEDKWLPLALITLVFKYINIFKTSTRGLLCGRVNSRQKNPAGCKSSDELSSLSAFFFFQMLTYPIKYL